MMNKTSTLSNPIVGGISGPGTGSNVQPTITEYSIRVPKNNRKKHHVMRFNYNLNVDFSQWRNGAVKMERENNMREFKMNEEEDMPKFGAGSEYNRDQKEEARRKKFGIIAKKYNPDNQPWILKVGSGTKKEIKEGKDGKKFRGIREGGVSENAAHFVFTQTKDGTIEAVPLHEWYNFQPIQRYKALTAEEAEEEFGRRRKCVNMWTMKMRMKLKNKDDDEAEMDPEETKAAKGSKGGDKKKLQISEMDEWMDSDDMSSSDDEEGEKKKKEDQDSDNEAKAKKVKAKGKLQNQKKKKRDVDDEAFEESDDGDEEGREKDYISDSSDSDSEPETKANKELKSVAEEDALRKLLTSDEDSDEEKSNKDEEESDEEKKKKADEGAPKENEPKPEKTKEKKRDDKKSKMQKFYDAINQGPGTGHASDFSSDSSDSEVEKPSLKKKKIEKPAHSSRSGTPVDATSSAAIKRKIEITNSSDNSNSPQSTPAKKPKTEMAPSVPFTSYNSSKDNFGNTEEAVRRYLTRKPMTTTELLKKIQSKKTGVSSDELVEMMTAILKKINPSKQRVQGKMYLSIRPT